jgi:prephenate dehydratase
VFWAVLPVENALEGSVLEVLEALNRPETELDILVEWSIPIQHVLAVLPQSKQPEIQLLEIQLTDIQTILSHPQALGQCRETLYEQFGERLALNPTASTSDAIQLLQAMADSSQVRTTAVIASRQAAKAAGLTVLLDNVADAPHNTTRFVLVCSRQNGDAGRHMFSALLEDTSICLPRLKTSVCFQTLDEPGALVKVLQAIYHAGFNLSKIESRPSRTRMGEYRFLMDAIGDCTPEAVPSLWDKIRPLMTMVSVLPAYWSLGELLPAKSEA